MAETSGFFNAQLIDGEPDRVYEAAQFAAYYATLIGNGVFANPATNLQVVAGTNALEVVVKPGSAFINGYWYKNDENLSLSFSPNSGGQVRWDEVVVELNLGTREISTKLIQGSLSQTRPTPTVTRTENVYQICLAQLKIPSGSTRLSNSNIYDIRTDSTYCGIVKGIIDQINTTNLFRQYNAAFNEFMSSIENNLGESTAGKLQFQIDDIRDEEFSYATFDNFSAVLTESSHSESAGRYITNYKTFSFVDAASADVKGSAVSLVNGAAESHFTFNDIGSYRVKLQFQGNMTTNVSPEGMLNGQMSISLKDLSSDTTLATFLDAESLFNGEHTYNGGDDGFTSGVWYSKEVIVDATADMLNKPFELIVDTFVLANAVVDVNITTVPRVYLSVERIKKETPVPQHLIGVVGMTQSDYDNLEDKDENTLYVVTPDPEESEE